MDADSDDATSGQYKIRFLRRGFESTFEATVPSADKKLRLLVALSLSVGRGQVSRETLKKVMYEGEWASDTSVDTPLSRLRNDDG